jgi:TetR/AcrR family transcriptional regulator, transcriptional repressor for nem operon
MPRDGHATRERILAVANELVLKHGFAATSLEQILRRAGVTKGAFFHHFDSKEELATALVDRYLVTEEQLVEATLRRAERLSSDPLQQVLIALGLLEELFAKLDAPHPGCLVASYLYQNDLMTDETMSKSRKAFLVWRHDIAAKLRAAAKSRPPRAAVDYEALGDLPITIIEGAMVMAKLFDDPKMIAVQLRQIRSHIELLFGVEQPVPQAGRPDKPRGKRISRISGRAM